MFFVFLFLWIVVMFFYQGVIKKLFPKEDIIHILYMIAIIIFGGWVFYVGLTMLKIIPPLFGEIYF